MVHASPTIPYTVLFMTKTQRLSSGQKLQIDSLSATVYVSHIDMNFGAIAWLPKLFGLVAMYLATIDGLKKMTEQLRIISKA